MAKVSINIDTFVDFDTKELTIDHLSEEIEDRLTTKYREEVIASLESIGFEFIEPDSSDGSTIRDEQYDEVLDQLREKFTVPELEALLNSK